MVQLLLWPAQVESQGGGSRTGQMESTVSVSGG